jgi:hypothetical protein
MYWNLLFYAALSQNSYRSLYRSSDVILYPLHIHGPALFTRGWSGNIATSLVTFILLICYTSYSASLVLEPDSVKGVPYYRDFLFFILFIQALGALGLLTSWMYHCKSSSVAEEYKIRDQNFPIVIRTPVVMLKLVITCSQWAGAIFLFIVLYIQEPRYLSRYSAGLRAGRSGF